jgi:tRNA threonylcarbamoyladenosine biosynthesis protein TsaB
MRVLAIDASTAWGSVAVVSLDRVVAERAARVPGAHLEWLIPAIDAMLAGAGLRRDQIEGVAVSIGPGGFSGLRIALATATAWAHAQRLPLAAVSTLDVIAAGLPGRGLALAALDARRGEIAAALHRRDQGIRRLTDDLLIEPAAVREALPPIAEPIVLAGDALERHAAALLDALAPYATVAEDAAWRPRASILGRLALARFLRGERDDPIGLVPRYAQRPVVRAYPGQEPA